MKPLKALWIIFNLAVVVIGFSYLIGFATMGTNVHYNSSGMPTMDNGECWETSYGYGCQPDLTVLGFELWNPMQRYHWQPLINFEHGYSFESETRTTYEEYNFSTN